MLGSSILRCAKKLIGIPLKSMKGSFLASLGLLESALLLTGMYKASNLEY